MQYRLVVLSSESYLPKKGASGAGSKDILTMFAGNGFNCAHWLFFFSPLLTTTMLNSLPADEDKAAYI